MSELIIAGAGGGSVVPGLPILSVEIALTPTALFVPGTWTEISPYVASLTTQRGKEHAMDRVEAGTGTITLTGAATSVADLWESIPVRAPVRITATIPSTEVTYPVFYGIVTKDDESIQTEIYSDFPIDIDDLLRLLALIEVRNPLYYQGYVFDSVVSAVETIRWWPIANTDRSSYIGSWSAPNTPSTPGIVNPVIGINDANVHNGGVVFGTQPGVCLYDIKTCADMTDGMATTVGGGGALSLTGPTPSANAAWAIDMWVIGQSLGALQDNFLVAAPTVTGNPLVMNPTGQVELSALSATFTHNTPVSDGLWHHVALVNNDTCVLMVDGVPLDLGAGFVDLIDHTILQTYIVGPMAGYVDEITLTVDASGLFTATTDEVITAIQGRYAAGSKLRNVVRSGERIAEVLDLCGFPLTDYYIDGLPYADDPILFFTSTTAGKYGPGYGEGPTPQVGAEIIAVPGGCTISGQPAVDTVDTPVVGDFTVTGGSVVVTGTNEAAYVTNQGCVEVQGITSSVTDNLAADLIGYVEDTESGIMVATESGTFNFLTRQWPIVGSTAKTVQFTLDDEGTNPYLLDAFSAPLDDLDLWSEVVVSPTNGTDQIVTDQATVDLYGSSTLRKADTQQVTLNQALWLAMFLNHIYTVPTRRVQSVTVDAATNAGTTIADLFAALAGIWCKFEVTRKPLNGTRYYLTGLVETINHDFQASPGTWKTTISLDPFRVNDVTLGRSVFQLDGTNAELHTSSGPVLL